MDGLWTATWSGMLNQTYTIRFKQTGQTFSGEYVDYKYPNKFSGVIYTGRGGRIVNIVHSLLTAREDENYYAVWNGIWRGNVIEGYFVDVQGNTANITLRKK